MKIVTKQGQIREVEWDALHQFYVYKDCTHPLQNRICPVDNVKGVLPTQSGYEDKGPNSIVWNSDVQASIEALEAKY